MQPFLNYLVGGALVAVIVVLALGLANMLRGGNSQLSQKLMRWRVGLQFFAILVILCVLFLRK